MLFDTANFSLDVFLIKRSHAEDQQAFSIETEEGKHAWRELMDKIGASTRHEGSTSFPDPRSWRQDIRSLQPLTGLRRADFGDDELGYLKAVASVVTPPRLPGNVPSLPFYFVKPPLVEHAISVLMNATTNTRGLVLTGIGGAGKSLIASSVARDKDVRRHFGDGVLWLDVNSNTEVFDEKTLLSQLEKLAHQFRDFVLPRHFRQGGSASKYDNRAFEDIKDAQGFFDMWHGKHSLRCLLVVDNVWNLVRIHKNYCFPFPDQRQRRMTMLNKLT